MDIKTAKKLLKIILFTLVISYALDKLVFFSLNKVSDEVMTGQAIGKLNQFLSIKDSTEFFVFGNSRANHHIDMGLFKRIGYNMGIDGTGIAYSSTLITTLPKHKKQVILVHVDTKNFFDSLYDGGDMRALKSKFQRQPDITNALIKNNQLSSLQSFYYSMNYNGNSISIIKNYFKPSYNYQTYNGYDPLYVSDSQESIRDIVLSQSETSDCPDNYSVNTKALEYLQSIKRFSDKNPEKTFIFLTSPIHNDFCDGDNKKLSLLMEELDLNYMDFSNLYKETNTNTYWKDRTHMSDKGAQAFSEHLINTYAEFRKP